MAEEVRQGYVTIVEVNAADEPLTLDFKLPSLVFGRLGI